jgi:hypothetical protein
MANSQEQELSLQLCIGAPMQKEERPDPRNRQAAENDRPQNEDQIWQRRHARIPCSSWCIAILFAVRTLIECVHPLIDCALFVRPLIGCVLFVPSSIV